MSNATVKALLVLFMIASLSISIMNPFTIIAFAFAGLILFGIIIVEERHSDVLKDLLLVARKNEKDISVAKNWMESFKGEHQTLHTRLAANEKTLAALSAELAAMDIQKVKDQMQILIDSNNSLVMSARGHSGSSAF